jgi:hypothetical protein
MSALFEEMPFSDFLHQPAATAARLDEVRSIRLRRRGADDLALVRADQTDRDATVVDFTSRLLAGLAKAGESEAIRRALAEALPWSTFLPESDRDRLLSELIEVAQGSASLRDLGPISVLLEQWRHSAEIYADPETYKQVAAEPGGDFGRVQLPGAAS